MPEPSEKELASHEEHRKMVGHLMGSSEERETEVREALRAMYKGIFSSHSSNYESKEERAYKYIRNVMIPQTTVKIDVREEAISPKKEDPEPPEPTPESIDEEPSSKKRKGRFQTLEF